MKKYADVLKKLYSVNLFKPKKENLELMEKAAKLIGNPHKDLKFIHVAGTNGKGSVVTKCAKVFELSGYKSGLYISPHISTFCERIQINGDLIPKEFVSDFLTDLFALSEKHSLDLTYFEYVTLLAFQYYKLQKVDIVSLETGLGGRLDATNIVDPLVSVITSIGLDHVDSLGPTIHHIAQEKAGIIKPNRPVVLGPCLPEDVFPQKATQVGAKVYSLKADEYTVRDFDNENTRISREVIRILKEGHPEFKLSEEAINEGLKANQPCRLEYVNTKSFNNSIIKDKIIVLDVAHNPPAIEKCMLTLTTKHPEHNIRVVYGSSGHKDIYNCLQVLKDYAYRVHLVQAKHHRVKKINELLEVAEQIKLELAEGEEGKVFEEVVSEGDIAKTIDAALQKSTKSEKPEITVVLGSFYLMGEARHHLGYKDQLDPIY